MRAGQDTQTDQMHAFITHAGDDLLRRQTNTLIHDFHARVATPDSDLLGTVGVSVQARLSDQHLERPAKRGGTFLHSRPQFLKLLGSLPIDRARSRSSADTGWCPEFSENIAQGLGPLARGHAGQRAPYRGRHDILAVEDDGAQPGESRLHLSLITRGTKRLQARHLIPLGCFVHLENSRRVTRVERRVRGLGKFVDTDNNVVSGGDVAYPFGMTRHELLFDIAQGRNHAAQVRHALDLCPGGVFNRACFCLNHRAPLKNIAVLQQVGLKGQDLLNPQAPLLVPGARQSQRFVPGR